MGQAPSQPQRVGEHRANGQTAALEVAKQLLGENFFAAEKRSQARDVEI